MVAFVAWEAHLEVWLLIAGVLALGFFAITVLNPKAQRLGYEPISKKQKFWFLAAVVCMWVVSDWPVHEIAETRLYSIHMVQHLFLSMLIPGMFVLSVPQWFFELLLQPNSKVWVWFKKFSQPLVAGVVFNALTVILHWSKAVQLSADNGVLHFALHLMIFVSGLLMWMPVIGPIKQWRLQPVLQCIYLFAMSIVPTVPGGWLVFAEDVVYKHYDIPQRLWGVDVLSDQQAAGVVMKLFGGFFLWAVILIVFARWASNEMKKDAATRQQKSTGQTMRARNPSKSV